MLMLHRGGSRRDAARLWLARHAGELFVAAARAFYNRAITDDLIQATDSPAHRVSKPRRLPSTRRALTSNELTEINQVARTTGNDTILDALLLRLHTETACRRSGALRLRLQDLDTERGLLLLRERGLSPFWADVDEGLDPVHFMQRASGRLNAHGHEGSGCLSGRRSEMRKLTDWCDGRDSIPVRVVTDSPGAGKSALIGMVVCAAHPTLNEATERLWRIDDTWTPIVNDLLAAVHARGRALREIVASLARQLRLSPADDGALETSDLLRLIRDWNRSSGRNDRPVLVIDALDETVNFTQVMDLLLPLARLTRHDGTVACRLLVGMRSWAELNPLRELAEAGRGLIDLDAVQRRSLKLDLENYVGKLLRHHGPYDDDNYAGTRGILAARIASTLTGSPADDEGQRWGEFLVARIYTHHLATAYQPISDSALVRDLGDAVPRTLPKLLERFETVTAQACPTKATLNATDPTHGRRVMQVNT
ncbi:hypothetical protein ACQEVZ_55940 [Dactylosporangium sp. CA-152071]|uniref:hypothetical protein n=1 Tax=Dactylosporangium sp. CA-152071 TaxID=3239933 RepID=UPI003D93A811